MSNKTITFLFRSISGKLLIKNDEPYFPVEDIIINRLCYLLDHFLLTLSLNLYSQNILSSVSHLEDQKKGTVGYGKKAKMNRIFKISAPFLEKLMQATKYFIFF